MIGIGMLIAFAVGIAVAVVGANIAGVSTDGLSATRRRSARCPSSSGKGWLAIVEEGALGFAIATLARSQLAGIGAGIAFFFGEQFASLFLPDVVKYLPFNAANAIVTTPGEGGFSGGGGGGPVDREPGPRPGAARRPRLARRRDPRRHAVHGAGRDLRLSPPRPRAGNPYRRDAGGTTVRS